MCIRVCDDPPNIISLPILNVFQQFPNTHTSHTPPTNQTQYKHAEAAEAAVLTRNGYQCYGKKIKVRVCNWSERNEFWSVIHPRRTGVKISTPRLLPPPPHSDPPTHPHTKQINVTTHTHTNRCPSRARPRRPSRTPSSMSQTSPWSVRVCQNYD